MIPRIALTPGEPAGIGPDLVARLAADGAAAELVAIADPQLIAARARQLGIQLELLPYQRGMAAKPSAPGRLLVDARPLRVPAQAGRPDAANAGYVLDTLNRAATGCLAGEFAAMVTAPVHKGVINDAGIAFSGHTEYLAGLTGAAQPVMLLVAGTLRVALLTTHLALRAVPDAITGTRIEAVARVLHDGLVTAFGIDRPRIAVLGLNPHAGESGHLGNEEQSVIGPALARLRSAGLAVEGPLPADSAFTPAALAQCDAVLAMYHDQGLPVLKHAGFGHAVNLTLGLPILRTSVDHGTALELAGTGRADAGSLRAALALAIDIARRRRA
ncbi:MAG: 4-hydroxythreonine-4-phosphate dehydrogenase [Gammaproteobacteria bacterium]|nr:MAG: 4-hydroxythreonine-4-phosphate dehydrogenase PdxA [Pseudomonadota bacterium]MBC6946030.1 4-hydroxythreonine-4-phosphate dehydrogenase PdxA [Gammaproteobacteria bacterium]MCE7896653.1 4-hydroxythreonine-4-phosphate dehydrogenase PdxA [Gammaproteobacteria bacterium PRO8]MDL1881747.1 4-hydroxythreonine-4-phosphate dehydrogenase PdxA [Gammaproteobacteria bacterium PRO2]MCQ3934762.1 4-hydroxythreonine-4-phosphate dehydrogenase PdxA [Gammaproteobacteria bacterium]